MKRLTFYIACPVILLIFTTVVVFSDWVIPTHKAEAGAGLRGAATEFTQNLNNALLGTISGSSATTAGATTANSIATISLLGKEIALDGIGWALAKQVVSSMIRSLINWVNSGFQGSPAFLQDLRQHLLGIVDQAAGEFIQSLGGIGEFICSPFRLDVQAALSVNYAQARSNTPSGPTAGVCTLSGIGSNIENFMSGTVDGMDDWFTVTSNPQNTPYGAYLEAEARMNVALRNAAGQEVQMLEFNEGFLSQRICEGINGQPSAEGQNCRITTPGRVIADQLNRALGAGQDALIEADEINELIGALLNQLMMKVLQGVNGLLGLGGNSGYTDPSIAEGAGSFLDAMVNEANLLGVNGETICRLIDTQANVEVTMLALTDYLNDPTSAPANNATIEAIDAIQQDALRSEILAEGNLGVLNEFVARLNDPNAYTTATKTAAFVQREVVVQFSQIQQANLFTTQAAVETKRATWTELYPGLRNLVITPTLPWGRCRAEILSGATATNTNLGAGTGTPNSDF